MDYIDNLRLFEGYYDDEDEFQHDAYIDIESNEIIIISRPFSDDKKIWNVKLVIDHGPPYFYAKDSNQNEFVLHLHWKVMSPDAAIKVAIENKVPEHIYAKPGEHASIVNLD